MLSRHCGEYRKREYRACDWLSRGLHGVQYVVNDEHDGLRALLQRYSAEAVHQRCLVHLHRNTFGPTTRWQLKLLTWVRNS